jgi:hypothetical protein
MTSSRRAKSCTSACLTLPVRRLVIDLYPAEPAERVVDGQTLMTVAWIVAQANQYARDHALQPFVI